MKFFPAIILVMLLNTTLFAQHINPPDLKFLKQKEDSLTTHALKLIQGINPVDRFSADSIFTRILVRTLKTKNSFYYPFDSLVTISKLYAPDSSFRIFTWQMVINDNIIRQHGAIQMRITDGSLKLFPLIDKSDITDAYEDSVGNNYGWMGAVYYKIILTTYSNRNYYTLLGYDENNIRSNKKLIEVLSFVNNEPIFGGRYFNYPNNELVAKNHARHVLEYKRQASPRLTYDVELDMIIMEHLVSESNEPNKKYTLIGDGDYEGFKWAGGRWVFVNKIFNEVTPEGKPPLPDPIRDNKGTIDETKLKGNEGETEKTTIPEKKKDE